MSAIICVCTPVWLLLVCVTWRWKAVDEEDRPDFNMSRGSVGLHPDKVDVQPWDLRDKLPGEVHVVELPLPVVPMDPVVSQLTDKLDVDPVAHVAALQRIQQTFCNTYLLFKLHKKCIHLFKLPKDCKVGKYFSENYANCMRTLCRDVTRRFYFPSATETHSASAV